MDNKKREREKCEDTAARLLLLKSQVFKSKPVPLGMRLAGERVFCFFLILAVRVWTPLPCLETKFVFVSPLVFGVSHAKSDAEVTPTWLQSHFHTPKVSPK